MKRFAIISLLVLSSCAGRAGLTPPEPVVQIKTVNVATPVPCGAMAKLGSEPDYADTDAAVRAAPDIFEQARILAKGRLQRVKRLGEYAAARVACTF